jgi:hypothetical protein
MNPPEDDLKPRMQPAFASGPPGPPKMMTGMPDDSDDKKWLYKEFLAEKEQIEKFRKSESQREGYDIGFEKALLNWIVKHRKRWLKQRHQGNAS